MSHSKLSHSTCELSQQPRTDLIDLVATTLGASHEASRIALESSQWNPEEAIDLLTFAQYAVPGECSRASRNASVRDLTQTVVDVCDVTFETAAAVLKATGYDADEAIDMLVLGQWNPNAVSTVDPTNRECAHECHTSLAQDFDTSPHRIVDTIFGQGEYAWYLRSTEIVRILSVHTEDAGIY
jgi:NACalpha-BTF3-like transcription factor